MNQEEVAQLQQQIAQLESFVRQSLSRDALSRYGTLKTAHPQKAVQLLVLVSQMIQAGKMKVPVSDEELKNVLIAMNTRK